MAVQPLDSSRAGAALQPEPVPAAPPERPGVRSVEHAQVVNSFSFLSPSQAGTPAEMGDKGRILSKVV